MHRTLKQGAIAVLALTTAVLGRAQSGAFELPQGSMLNVITVMAGADTSPLWLEVGIPSTIRFAYPHVQSCYVPTTIKRDGEAHHLLVRAESLRCVDAKGLTLLNTPLQAQLVDPGGEFGLPLHADTQADVPYLIEGTRLKLLEKLTVQPATPAQVDE
ncbi:hypothetical protein KTD31_00865 [Burkholderia multivorans]|uniref:hypothetical protein n=1 Tax=Burkholderia multivorans TaxID=87883 RepID=UPI001C250A62|nr:hypothetical protein [Burkholderia multivorans]MBU9199952.1 hypothetical protein [Burkholderia multivorans]MDN8078929.1 hypothetical protein [Burkholderia multivorans]